MGETPQADEDVRDTAAGLASLHAYVGFVHDMGIYDMYGQGPAVAGPLDEDALKALLAHAGRAVPDVSTRPVEHSGPQRPAAAKQPAVAGPQRVGSAAAGLLQTPFERAVSSGLPRSAIQGRPAPQDIAVAGQAPPAEVNEGNWDAMPKPNPLEQLLPAAAAIPANARRAALTVLQAEIGDCTRCPLAYAGRHEIVFGDGDPAARLMFVGEGPGADEDEQGRPFVGKAGQLLGNMITAMGLTREQVYIANVVMCRPPKNRAPEFVEATTCSQFLLRQIDIVRPEVIVALGATAATYLLGVKQSLASLRGEWHRVREAKVAVTYHPAFLLRDPRQKGETWKDLQRVMAELGIQAPARKQ